MTNHIELRIEILGMEVYYIHIKSPHRSATISIKHHICTLVEGWGRFCILCHVWYLQNTQNKGYKTASILDTGGFSQTLYYQNFEIIITMVYDQNLISALAQNCHMYKGGKLVFTQYPDTITRGAKYFAWYQL